ncbi:arsenate reductase [Leptolyngbya valderiana BDU 20041]|nr:arsenate reductase [Leptolyngbya valderiana BDU 20041]
MEYWHNPRCTKSREALALLHAHGVAPEVREYLKSPPGADELKQVAEKLRLATVRDMMRTREAAYKARGLKDVDDEDALVRAMTEEPKLIERPILINGPRAVVGRPPERILDAV